MMTTLREQLTVLVPTCNRQDRLLRVLRYYSASRCPASMRLLDSSTTPIDARAIEPFVARGTDVSVTSYAPTVPALVKVLNGLETVSTPYAVLWADDDFIVPGALEEGVRVLTRHPEVSVVHGQSGLFHVRNGCLQWVDPYPQYAIMDETASARLLKHFGRYSVMFYSIHRTEALKRNFDRICELGLDWHTWGEIALSALAVIQGKAYALPRLYMVREAHEGMNSARVQRARQGLDPFDWLTDTTFARECGSYKTFRDALAPGLMQQDGLDGPQAWEIIKQAFWSYLTQGFVKKWGVRRRPRGVSPRARLREAAKRIPGLRSAWRSVRSRLPGQDTAIGLHALLRPQSRYHQDFIPIYRAITQETDERGDDDVVRPNLQFYEAMTGQEKRSTR